MQLLLEGSAAEGEAAGLGLVPGHCRKFDAGDSGVKVLHVGWSTVTPKGESRAIKAQLDDSRYYFVHSCFVAPARAEHVAGSATHLSARSPSSRQASTRSEHTAARRSRTPRVSC